MWVKFVKIGTYELFKVGLEAQWLQPYPPYRTHKVVQHMHVGTVGEPNHMDASGASPPLSDLRVHAWQTELKIEADRWERESFMWVYI
jgi:hypothetical protein